MARRGFEPLTLRFSVEYSTTELPGQDVGGLTLLVNVMALTNHNRGTVFVLRQLLDGILTRDSSVYSPGGGFLARG